MRESKLSGTISSGASASSPPHALKQANNKLAQKNFLIINFLSLQNFNSMACNISLILIFNNYLSICFSSLSVTRCYIDWERICVSALNFFRG